MRMVFAAIVAAVLLVTGWLAFVAAAMFWIVADDASWARAFLTAGLLHAAISIAIVLWIRNIRGARHVFRDATATSVQAKTRRKRRMMRDGDLEEEIAMVELRIQQRKTDIIAESRKVSTALQHAVTSPAAFALAAGAGFILGRITLGSPGRSGGSRLLSLFESVRGLIEYGPSASVDLVDAPLPLER